MKKGALVCGMIVVFALVGSVTAASETTLIDRRPIEIGSNYQFSEENGVVAGSGTIDDPYIIEGWRIDAGYSDYGIRIHRTTRSFIIRNVEISGAGNSAIVLSYVKNGRVENCRLTGNWIGITLSFASHNRISECTLSSNTDGIRLYFSNDNQILCNTVTKTDTAIWLVASNTNEIIKNKIVDNYMGAYLDLGSQGNLLYRNAFLDNIHNAHSDELNRWDYKGEGNYWYNYVGIDADENGIGDSPYIIRGDSDQDNFPLLSLSLP
jgi:parallel beta-helix repeat protein